MILSNIVTNLFIKLLKQFQNVEEFVAIAHVYYINQSTENETQQTDYGTTLTYNEHCLFAAVLTRMKKIKHIVNR